MSRTIEFQIDVDTNLKSIEDLNKEIAKLEQEFETVSIGSDKFEQLGNQIKAAKGQLKDIDLQFEALDKEQRAAALVDTFSGLAGAVGAVSGAFIAFGAESEAIENAEKKLLGIIAVVQGIREVSDGYIASIKLFGPALKNFGKATIAAFKSGSKAAQAFKISLATIGIGALILAIDLLIENFDAIKESLGFAEDQQKKYNDALIEAEASVQGQIFELGYYNDIVQDVTRSDTERLAALNALNEAGVITEDVNLNNAESLDELNERVERNIDLIVAQTKAEAARQLLGDALKKQLEAESSSLDDNISFWEQAGNAILSAGNGYVATYRNIQTAAENRAKAEKDANEEVARATAVYEEQLNALLPMQQKDKELKEKVTEELRRQGKVTQATIKAIDDLAKKYERAAAVAAQTQQELELVRLDGFDREKQQIENQYAERLQLLTEAYGAESEEVKALLELQGAEIQAVRDKYDQEALDKKKEYDQQYLDLQNEIGDALAVTVEQQQQKEKDDLNAYYAGLIEQAEKFGLDTVELKKAQVDAVAMLDKQQKDEQKARDDEEVANKKQQQEALRDLAINSGLQLISTLSTLNQIYDKDNEEAAKKSFERQKALSIVETLISTYSTAQKAYASQFVPLPDPSSPVRGAIAAGLAVAGGLAKIAVIKNQKFNSPSSSTPPASSGGGGGGGSIPSGPSYSDGIFGAPSTPPTPVFTAGGTSAEGMRAYVVAGDVRNGLEANRKIEQRRTL